ncbi:MAG: sulfatase [Bacteroidetes bacterium]|nr:sulfatase [Bacteroidota bacterium]
MRRFWLIGLALVLAGCSTGGDAVRPPNLIVIFADDLGYGDLGVYGHPTIMTPRLDRMAQEGLKFTQFYTAASVCTPSRAGLLTGRLPIRSGMASDNRRVLFPDSRRGLPPEEITLAEVLKEQGYATAAIGKWHLGHMPEYTARRHGFDYFFGLPYSNDMDRVPSLPAREQFSDPKSEYWDLTLLRNEEVIERPARQETLTRRYTEEAIAFLRQHKEDPFFIYLAHSMVHVPLFRSEEFEGSSRRGLYGDAVEEMDFTVGMILDALKEEGLEGNTMVVFTSDNGPWLVYGEQGGSSGLLHGGKGMTWEGGMRVPGIAWWPGTIAPGSVSPSVTSTMDLLPTMLDFTKGSLPDSVTLDGASLRPILEGDTEAEIRNEYYYYRGATLYAARMGKWKAHFVTEWAYRADSERTEHDPPALYDLDLDPEERFNVAERHPDIVTQILARVERHRAGLNPRPNQLEERIDR